VVFLLRHASAGERLASPSPDRSRALDESGRLDAVRLASALAPFRFERIVSSPLARCVETVEAVAVRLDLGIELREELAPGAPYEQIIALLDGMGDRPTLACTHREAFETLFVSDVTCEKGGGWFLAHVAGGWRPDVYIGPPVATPVRTALAVASS
jgi:phosphohistidine phosphatase SixA